MSERAPDSIPTRHSLLHRLKDWGDDAGWREFFDAYWELIYNVARKAGLTDTEAQEVVQETVIGVAKEDRRFRGGRRARVVQGVAAPAGALADRRPVPPAQRRPSPGLRPPSPIGWERGWGWGWG